jgi:porin
MHNFFQNFQNRISGRGPGLTWVVTLLAFLCLSSGALAADPDYSGEFLKRTTMTGDWGGARNDLAKKGLTFDLNLTQTEQGVVGGGTNSSWEYGGRGDLNILLDTGKMGLWPGGFLTTEVEGNFGHSVNLRNGGVMPVNTNQIFPVTGVDEVTITAVNFAQFLSENFGLVAGKLATITATSGDMNEFAHGKGDTQFMNLALNFNPVLLMTVPYSTLGAGMIILPTKDPKAAIISLSVLSSEGKASTTGFDNLNANRLTFAGEGRMRTGFFGLTGHQLVGYTYSNKEFTSLDQRLGVDKLTNNIAKEKGSWAFYYNFDQYLYEPEKGSGKGVGVFGRFGASDGNPNPMNYFFSLGVGGKGVIASRPDDGFGLGWYFIDVKSPSFNVALAGREFLRDEQGFEAYYNLSLTKWAILTPDIQVVHPARKEAIEKIAGIPYGRKSVDTATTLGLRLQLVF